MDAEIIEFKCATCGKVLSSAGYLKNHIRLSHPEQASNEKEPTDMAETKAMAEVKPTNSQPEPTPKQVQTSSLTPDERALVDQITRSKDDWNTITEESMVDFSLGQDWGKLPSEAQERQDRKEFAFRWCERTPKRVAELTNASAPLKWWVANRTTAPFLSKYVDPTVGGILRLDQILLIKPWKLHQLVKDAVSRSAKAMYDSRELTKGGAQKIQSRDSSDHLKVVSGERAHVKGGDLMYDGESGAEVGDLVAAD
jgi:hypothetical protein